MSPRSVAHLLVCFALATAAATPLGAQSAQKKGTHNPHGPLKDSCDSCHTLTSWKPIRSRPEFSHDKTSYPLRGMHEKVDCRSCHIKLVFSDVGTKCADCHADLHRGQFGAKCEQCHTVKGWNVSIQAIKDHDNRFPLVGAHSAVECSACHTGAAVGQFTGLRTECVSCHLQDYQNTSKLSLDHKTLGFSTTCENCHSADSWLGASFDHSITGFALTGAHAKLDCQTCHIGGKFAGTPADCFSCHQKDFNSTANLAGVPNHISAGFSHDCVMCHSMTNWLNATFDHNATTFPLQGAHTKVACDTCHAGNYSGTLPTNCYGCHQKDYNNTANIPGAPNHVTGSFPQDCTVCHSMTDWLNAKFDHNKTTFPLTGAHTSVACDTCHAGNYSGNLPTNCFGCHQKDYNNTANIAGVPNHVANNFPQDCSGCHSTTNWLNATFNHNTTKFPLVGAHTSVSCDTCHAGNYSGNLPTNCYGCHQKDYNKTANIAGVPNHVTANFPQDCTLCHSMSNWLNASFDHSKTTFPLTGAHTSVACDTCHAGNYSGTLPTNCFGCHQKDYNNTANISGVPNHAALGYPQDCTICHSTSNWTSAMFNHNNTPFPLTGKHADPTVTCLQCHVGGRFAGTPTDCYACHAPEYNSTTNPNHAAAGFPTTCQNCHSTVNWLNAQFNHTWFPVPHRGISNCTDCHTNPNNYAVFACTNCHTHNKTDMDNAHQGVSGYVYNSQNCYSCHPQGTTN